MERIKRILTDILFPHPAVAAALIPAAAALLIYVFVSESAGPVMTYGAYLLSAYALSVACARIPAICAKAKDIKRGNPFISRYAADTKLRVRLSLCGSFVMNAAYALAQLWLGFIHHSLWFYALSGYYALLGVMRYCLLREMNKHELGENRLAEYRLYRLCGFLLVLMNMALSVVVFYIAYQNRGFAYHYIMTLAMAAYTFYSFTMALIHIVQCRRYQSPVMSAVKTVNLAAALVSVLSLETAMLAAFGGADDAFFRRMMTACTGAAVCAAVLLLAVYMIVRATKEIRKIEGASCYGTESESDVSL